MFVGARNIIGEGSEGNDSVIIVAGISSLVATWSDGAGLVVPMLISSGQILESVSGSASDSLAESESVWGFVTESARFVGARLVIPINFFRLAGTSLSASSSRVLACVGMR